MSRTAQGWTRLVTGAVILAVVVGSLGVGPFLSGMRAVSGWSLGTAAGLTVVTTVASAWRWSLVSRGLGVGVAVRPAVAAYYRSQFLNTVLPGGVLGDVHRGIDHGRGVGEVGRALRAVAWERSAGQLVQVTLALLLLLVLPSPVHGVALTALVAVLSVGVAALIAARLLPHGGPSRWSRALRAAATDVRDGLLATTVWPGVLFASLVVVAGHTATFFVALRAVGVTAPTLRLLPLVLLVMLAMAVPANVGGWGPREGAAAWLFAAAGLGAGRGVAAATAYGVLVFAATLPGAALLVTAMLVPARTERGAGGLTRTAPRPEVVRG